MNRGVVLATDFSVHLIAFSAFSTFHCVSFIAVHLRCEGLVTRVELFRALISGIMLIPKSWLG